LAIALMVGMLTKHNALTNADTARAVSKSRRRHPVAPRRRIAWLPVIVGIACMVTTVPALEASRSAGLSQALRTPASASQAVLFAARATQLDPNRAEYWQALGLANVAAKRWSEAAAAFDRGARLAPYDIRFLTDGVQVQLVLANAGDKNALDRGLELALHAVAIDPNT